MAIVRKIKDTCWQGCGTIRTFAHDGKTYKYNDAGKQYIGPSNN
jgi:hypothetical protein